MNIDHQANKIMKIIDDDPAGAAFGEREMSAAFYDLIADMCRERAMVIRQMATESCRAKTK